MTKNNSVDKNFRKCWKLYPLSEIYHHISIVKSLKSPAEQKPDYFTQFFLETIDHGILYF